MSLTLRVLCVIGAAITFFGIARQVKKSKIKIEDSLFWLLLSGSLVFIALFPAVPRFLARLTGFQTTSNFIIVAVIAILLIKEFHNTTEISMLKHRVTELAQEDALRDHEKRNA